LDRAIMNGEPYAVEFRLTLSETTTRWIAASGRVERDPQGRGALLRGVFMDVTERRLAEQQAERQRNELAHLSRAATLGELSGSLAHELNQPLAIVLSNAQAAQRLLNDPAPDLGELRDILGDIVAKDRRAGAVIKRLHGLLKPGESKVQSVCLESITGEVLNLMRSTLMERGVVVTRDLQGRLPWVSGDPVQLQQVMLNLVLNACEAMADNPLPERLLGIRSGQREGWVCLSLRDHGCGLPEGDAEGIFKPFFTTKREGLGMGLAICRSIASVHGGRLWAESNASRGTTFHLELPAAVPMEGSKA
jgi:two-component system, LuxR family, sensor kinase FixL